MFCNQHNTCCPFQMSPGRHGGGRVRVRAAAADAPLLPRRGPRRRARAPRTLQLHPRHHHRSHVLQETKKTPKCVQLIFALKVCANFEVRRNVAPWSWKKRWTTNSGPRSICCRSQLEETQVSIAGETGASVKAQLAPCTTVNKTAPSHRAISKKRLSSKVCGTVLPFRREHVWVHLILSVFMQSGWRKWCVHPSAATEGRATVRVGACVSRGGRALGAKTVSPFIRYTNLWLEVSSVFTFVLAHMVLDSCQKLCGCVAAVCPGGCIPNSTCIKPGVCRCNPGYTGGWSRVCSLSGMLGCRIKWTDSSNFSLHAFTNINPFGELKFDSVICCLQERNVSGRGRSVCRHVSMEAGVAGGNANVPRLTQANSANMVSVSCIVWFRVVVFRCSWTYPGGRMLILLVDSLFSCEMETPPWVEQNRKVNQFKCFEEHWTIIYFFKTANSCT